MHSSESDHYATLGLDRRCTLAQVRAAYRLLSKKHHPDLNPGSDEANARSREINAAHETLNDPERRRAYDRELNAAAAPAKPARTGKIERNISQDAQIRIEDFLRGTSLDALTTLLHDRVRAAAERGNGAAASAAARSLDLVEAAKNRATGNVNPQLITSELLRQLERLMA